jgi:putative restriction endonuclease
MGPLGDLTETKLRHILALSGGKDSTALAIYMRDRVPEMEYVFCDTHKELPDTYDYLLKVEGEARARVVDSILNEWWPETLHGDIREDLALDRLDSRRRAQRDRQFTIDVLENFRYSCASCGFHAVLNRVATGIDAVHIHWHSLKGPDDVENGIALCKLHHWAFDKGILGINDEARICIASVFSAQQDGGLPLESLVNRNLAVQPRKAIAKRFLDWHRNNVYLGTAE